MRSLVGRTIKLFLIDGSADGMLTAEIMNWTGHVLYAPRARIVELLQRPEARRTGVYLLLGNDPEQPEQMLVYVGEGDNVGLRLASHSKDAEKDFWEFVCVITSKDLNLTKAHVRYLESRLLELIRTEARARLWNKSEPDFDLLPEADISDMDDFLARLQMLLPVLGIQFVRPTPKLIKVSESEAALLEPTEDLDAATGNYGSRASSNQNRPTAAGGVSPIFKFSSPGIRARAVETGGQMVILSGSQARADDQPSLSSNVKTYREQLKSSGKLVPNGGFLQFAEDVAFTSPSAAAQAVMGTSRNGRIDWVLETGQNYASWQESQITRAQEALGGAQAERAS